jgi:ankyrin repeat protein
MKDEDGMTALMLAASHNNAESIKALLSNVNNATQLAFMKNKDDYNALMLAVFDGSTETINALLDHVKSPAELIYFSNHSGTTVLMLCAQNENIDDTDSNVMTVMLERATKVRDPNYRMSTKYKKGGNTFISLEPDSLIFLTDINGKNAFMVAAEESNDVALVTLFNWTTDKLGLLKEKNNSQRITVDLLDPDQCHKLIEEMEVHRESMDLQDVDAVLTLLQKQMAHFLQAY